MTPKAVIVLSLLACVACDGGEIVVFSSAQAGTAGSDPAPESGGLAGTVVAGDASGGLKDIGGSGGAATSGAGGGSGNGSASVDKPCQTTEDCDPAWLCQKQNCSESQGVCLPRPVADDPRQAPVCGCDHITYWNDTLRQQFGISASTDGECRSGVRTCVANEDCGFGSCSQRLLNPSSCSMPGTGQCWITPIDCANTGDKPGWLLCPALGGPNAGPPPCMTLCQAVQAGRAFWRAMKGDCL